jgi:hypothetical protein
MRLELSSQYFSALASVRRFRHHHRAVMSVCTEAGDTAEGDNRMCMLPQQVVKVLYI